MIEPELESQTEFENLKDLVEFDTDSRGYPKTKHLLNLIEHLEKRIQELEGGKEDMKKDENGEGYEGAFNYHG